MIYKICGRAEWQAAERCGAYAGTADDARDGYIHLSTAEQLAGTLAKYYATRDDLLLIGFDPDRLGPALKWEPARGGQLFPHLYAPLPTGAAACVFPLTRDAAGIHDIPTETT